MLTLFTIPKPFVGEDRRDPAQRTRELDGARGRRSGRAVGDEDGHREAARASAPSTSRALSRNEHGTPRLDDAFARVDAMARQPLRCFVNADIILLDDFLPAVRRAAAMAPSGS